MLRDSGCAVPEELCYHLQAYSSVQAPGSIYCHKFCKVLDRKPFSVRCDIYKKTITEDSDGHI